MFFFQVCLVSDSVFLPLGVARSSMSDAVADKREFQRFYPISNLSIRCFYSSCNN